MPRVHPDPSITSGHRVHRNRAMSSSSSSSPTRGANSTAFVMPSRYARARPRRGSVAPVRRLLLCGDTVSEDEEVVPVKQTTGVLPSEVTVGR